MRISKEHKFVFVSTPKAATMTLYKVLSSCYGPLVRVGWHTIMVPKDFRRGYFVWTVCRNPYTRALSSWWSTMGSGRKHPNGKLYYPKLPRGMSFEGFVEWMTDPNREPGGGRKLDTHFITSQSARLGEYQRPPDQVLRFEKLHEEFRTLPFYNGGPKEWPWINTSEGKQEVSKLPAPHMVFTQRAADCIWGWDRAVFERFGYQRESWKEL